VGQWEYQPQRSLLPNCKNPVLRLAQDNKLLQQRQVEKDKLEAKQAASAAAKTKTAAGVKAAATLKTPAAPKTVAAVKAASAVKVTPGVANSSKKRGRKSATSSEDDGSVDLLLQMKTPKSKGSQSSAIKKSKKPASMVRSESDSESSSIVSCFANKEQAHSARSSARKSAKSPSVPPLLPPNPPRVMGRNSFVSATSSAAAAPPLRAQTANRTNSATSQAEPRISQDDIDHAVNRATAAQRNHLATVERDNEKFRIDLQRQMEDFRAAAAAASVSTTGQSSSIPSGAVLQGEGQQYFTLDDMRRVVEIEAAKAKLVVQAALTRDTPSFSLAETTQLLEALFSAQERDRIHHGPPPPAGAHGGGHPSHSTFGPPPTPSFSHGPPPPAGAHGGFPLHNSFGVPPQHTAHGAPPYSYGAPLHPAYGGSHNAYVPHGYAYGSFPPHNPAFGGPPPHSAVYDAHVPLPIYRNPFEMERDLLRSVESRGRSTEFNALCATLSAGNQAHATYLLNASQTNQQNNQLASYNSTINANLNNLQTYASYHR